MTMNFIRSMNKVLLIGKMGQDPEVKSWPNGDKYCNFSVATVESYKDKNSGDWKNITEWHRVQVMNSKLAEKIGQSCAKGSTVLVQGAIKTRKWKKQDGTEQSIVEIKVGPLDDVALLAPPFDYNQANGQQSQPQSRRTPPVPQEPVDPWDIGEEIPY